MAKSSPLKAVLFFSGLILLPGCQEDGQPTRSGGQATVTGTLTYREDVSLAPGSVAEIELRDVTLLDVASTLIARQVIPDPGPVPIRFRIEYNREEILPDNRYAVQARINYPDGSLAFTNDTAYEVITQGQPSEVDMVLVMVNE